MTKYARTCRKSGRNDLAYKVLASTIAAGSGEPLNFDAIVCHEGFVRLALYLVGSPALQPADEYSGLTLERCCLAYDLGDKSAARDGLRKLVLRLGDRLQGLAGIPKRSRSIVDRMEEDTKMLARCLHTLGDYVKHDDMVRPFKFFVPSQLNPDLPLSRTHCWKRKSRTKSLQNWSQPQRV